MEEYLLTARSVTHAQRMTQALAQNGMRAAMGRAPVGLTGSGCGYVLRMPASAAAQLGNRASAGLSAAGERI